MGSLELMSEAQTDGQDDIITLDGDLDCYTAPRLREVLSGLILSGTAHIVLDCRLLNHVDSSGLGTLVGALKQSSDGAGSFALAGPNHSFRRTLQITGLDSLFPIYATVSDAREASAGARLSR